MALAASIFIIAKPQVTKQATGVFDKTTVVEKGINLDGHRAPGPISFDFKGLKASNNMDGKKKKH